MIIIQNQKCDAWYSICKNSKRFDDNKNILIMIKSDIWYRCDIKEEEIQSSSFTIKRSFVNKYTIFWSINFIRYSYFKSQTFSNFLYFLSYFIILYRFKRNLIWNLFQECFIKSLIEFLNILNIDIWLQKINNNYSIFV